MPDAQLAADRYERAVTRLRRARAGYVAADIPLNPVDGRPPTWTPRQHAAAVELSRAWQEMILAMSAWVAAPKT